MDIKKIWSTKAEDVIKAYDINNDNSKKYYQKFVHQKSEQQKFLEELLGNDDLGNYKIADIACGSGTVTTNLLKKFPNSKFFLTDINKAALELAAENLKDIKNIELSESSIYNMQYKSDTFDFVFCGQTLLALDDPEKAMYELIRICKPGGKIYISSLFNLHHDVDIHMRYIDHTLPSSKQNISLPCNTISAFILKRWLNQRVSSFKLHEFVPKIDFKNKYTHPRGAGSYTVNTPDKKLQLSGGMLMNWAILEIIK